MIFKFERSSIIKGFFFHCLIITLGLFYHIPSTFADTRLLILGDSLSASYRMQQKEGWVSLLQNTYNERKTDIKLINASITGETTANALARFDKILANQKPDMVIIELGGNDGLRGFPLKKTKQNLLQIIDKAEKQNVIPVLMQIRIPPNFGPRYTKMFTQMYQDIAQETDTKLMPFFMEIISIDPKLIQADGLHPAKEAMPLIRDFMDKEIKKLLDTL